MSTLYQQHISIFGVCELLEAGSWDTGTVRKLRGRGTPAVGSLYQTTTGENTVD
jgi:hypothetical protein